MVLDKPGYQVSVHINIYLTTSGKEAEFMEDITLLEDTFDTVSEKYPDSVLFIRGDANSSPVPRSHNKRDLLFSFFIGSNNLHSLPTNHGTYHHFVNNGKSDSSIDVLLSSLLTSEGFPNNCHESLVRILCGKSNPLIDSSHDALVSSVSFSPVSTTSTTSVDDVPANRIVSTKHKVSWSEEGILAYQELLAHTLPSLQLETSDDLLPGSASVLFQLTNHILTKAAKLTNEYVDLSVKHTKKKKNSEPTEITEALDAKRLAHRILLSTDRSSNIHESEKSAAKDNFSRAKSYYQNIVRKHDTAKECKKNDDFNNLLSQNPKQVFKNIKSQKSKESRGIKSLLVGEKLYTDEGVADGFFDSISALKTMKPITSSFFDTFAEDHRDIIDICKAGMKIPRITVSEAQSLLKKIRPGVSDFYSITAAHYLNGGEHAVSHFLFLFNTILENIENATIEEMNRTHAVILHKGHGKDKNSASSYRTISSCPFVAKTIDIYLGQLSKADWKSRQADTQFQGEGMSHEMAALLLTITVHHSLSLKLPIFVLLLDAKSAFDLVLRLILVRRLYLDSPQDQRIIYWDHRLTNRTTFCQWDDQLMGPIRDELGLEQGGPNSSDLYKIYNNEQLSSAQNSLLGTSVGNVLVSAIGQADDTALVSNDISALQYLLDLTLKYCEKYQVELSAVKTKLLCFSAKDNEYVKYVKLVSPVHIGNTDIPFVETAEHVGIIRSVSGNLPHIQQRIVSHRKALASILFTGMSRRHRANPLASIRAEKIFGTPVLFSGMAALILKKSETEIISHHVKITLQGLLKLHEKTPDPVIYFMSGTFPAEATLHLKQLTLFGMICRLHGNILYKIAEESLLTCSDTDKSWFAQISSLCFTYELPHPLKLLEDPPLKEHFKKLLKTNIADFWQSKLRVRSKELSSLRYFKPNFMSLLHPHPLLSTASHSYDVNKMIVQLRMVSGRYRVGTLVRHFAPANSGLCELCNQELEDLQHLLLTCPFLQERRITLTEYSNTVLQQSATGKDIFDFAMSNDIGTQAQFLIDCSVLPFVITAAQENKNILAVLFKVTEQDSNFWSV